MRSANRYALFFVLFLVVIFWQCASVPDMHYYFLEFESGKQKVSDKAKFPITLKVSNFAAKPFYQERGIVYREQILEGKRYHYHRWAASPAEMFKDQLVQQLRNSGLFSTVIDKQLFAKADYLLSGEILAIEEVDHGEQWYGRVKIEVSLIDEANQTPVWLKQIEKETPIAKKQPIEVVKSINQSARQCVDEIISGLDQYFSGK